MKRTLLMIHGMMCSPAVWDNYRGFFESRGYRCITPALRYHDAAHNDQPDARLGTAGIEDYADDMEKIIGSLPSPPVLMGHSMGGLIAQMLAARGKAAAAVLLTPASPRGVFNLRYSVIKSFAAVMSKWKWYERPFRLGFNAMAYAMLNCMPPEKQRELYSQSVYESGRAAFQIGMWFFDKKKSTKVDYSSVKCPILVIAGKKDRIVPAGVVRSNAGRYAAAEYVELENHAHWVLGEPGWETIAGRILAWMDANVT